MNLLTTNNVKTIKGEKKGYKTYILYMTPNTQNSKGINLCPFASKGCIKSCLVSSGFGGMFSHINAVRMAKTEFYLNDRNGFLFQLKSEIEKISKKHSGEKIAIRLNGTTDISFEKFKVFDGKNIFEHFSDVQFYDYTKNWKRFDKVLLKNYYLLFSRSETNESKCLELLEKNINVAIVFDKLPETYNGFKVLNGDGDDLRFLDKRGYIIGLKYKKITSKGAPEINRDALENGFVVTTNKLVLTN